MNVVGVGIDAVDLDRFRTVLARTPSIRTRVFTASELSYANEATDPTERLGARFAAKEATMKALGVGLGAFALSDVEVILADSGAPSLVLHRGARRVAGERGVTQMLVSMTHTATQAQAIVLAGGAMSGS